LRTTLWGIGILAALLAVLGGTLYLQGRPAQATPAQYVAMGSSYAAGPGITGRAADSPWFCARSADNYAHQLARLRKLSLVDVSCSGAQTGNVLSRGQLLQPAQLEALRPETGLVTLTIGGNDIEYARSLMSYGCGQRSRWIWKVADRLGGCKPAPQARVEAGLKTLPQRFDRIAAEVRRRSPQARLVLLTYQTVLPPAGSCAALGMSPAQAGQMRALAASLADLTRQAAARNGALLFDAAAATAGHDVCAAEPWMLGQGAPVPMHPNLAGMTALAQGLNRMLDTAPAASN